MLNNKALKLYLFRLFTLKFPQMITEGKFSGFTAASKKFPKEKPFETQTWQEQKTTS